MAIASLAAVLTFGLLLTISAYRLGYVKALQQPLLASLRLHPLSKGAQILFRQSVTAIASLAAVLTFGLLLMTSAYGFGYAKALQPPADDEQLTMLSDNERRVLAVHAYADSLGVDPELALAVSFVENVRGVPDAKSSRGAVGIMQVRPSVWLGSFPECGVELTDVTTNACYGVNVLRHYLMSCHNDVRCALRKYVGARSAAKAQSYIADVDSLRPVAQAWLTPQ